MVEGQQPDGMSVRVIDGILIDIMALSLASLTLVLGLAGVFAFLNLRNHARKEAQKVASEISHAVAESETNRYLQENLMAILAEYDDFKRGSVRGSVADDIASAQED